MNKGLNFFKRWIPSDFRSRRIFYTGVSSIATKGVNFLIQIVSVPLLLNYLGVTRFGVYSAVMGVLGYISFADLGLGLGLQNKLPKAISDKNSKKINELVSSSFFTLVLSGLFIASVVFIVNFLGVNLGEIFGLKDNALDKEATLALNTLLYLFAFSIPFSISEKIYNSYQEGYFVNFWMTLGKLLGLGVLFFVIKLGLNIPGILGALYGSEKFFLMASFLGILISKKKNVSFPSLRIVNLDVFKSLFKDGISFFIIQLSYTFLIALDSFLIIRYVGAEAATTYAIGTRLAFLFVLPFQLFIGPLLPAINDALAKNDFDWLRQSLTKMIKYVFLGVVLLSLLFVVSSNFILKLWVGTIQLSSDELVIFTLFLGYNIINVFVSTIMLSSRYFNFILKFYPIVSIGTFLLKLALINIYTPSVPLIMGTTIIVSTLFYLVPSFVKLKKDGLLTV